MLSAITQRSVLQVSRRQAHAANLERYGLIRKFFLRQVNTTPSASFSFTVTARISGGLHPILRYARCPFVVDMQRRLQGVRAVHTTNNSAQEDKQNRPTADNGAQTNSPDTEETSQKTGSTPDLYQYDNYPRFFRNLALSLPHLHRPTRDDFLNAATGFWSRLRVRFRWLTIRSFRKYNADDISAFVTWFFMSQTLWLFVGTYVAGDPCSHVT